MRVIALCVAVLIAGGSEAYAQNRWQPAVRLTYTLGCETFPDLSPDGSRVAFSYQDRQATWSLCAMDVTGANRSELYRGKVEWSLGMPDWSPDGSEILFSVDCDIVSYDLRSRVIRTVVQPDSGTCAQRPQWSPDGRRVAYKHRQLDQSMSIVVLDADTGITHPIKDDIQFGFFDLSWSPDGSRLLYTDYGSKGSTDVFYVRTDDGSVGQLTDDADFDVEPVWLPGEMGILFLSERAGLSQSVWLMDEDGSNVRDAGMGTLWGPSGISVSSDGRGVVLTSDLGDGNWEIYYAERARDDTAVEESGWGRVKSSRAAPK